jgi:hypothetical protein
VTEVQGSAFVLGFSCAPTQIFVIVAPYLATVRASRQIHMDPTMQDCRIFSLIAMILYLACPSAAADFMKGKVVMENGEAPPARVVIQRVCPGGAARPEALTNKQGIYVWPVAENFVPFRREPSALHHRHRADQPPGIARFAADKRG